MTDKIENNFEKLAAIDISKLTEEKTGLTYLRWADAWTQVNKVDPKMSYKLITFEGTPYVYDPLTGYMVFTEVTILGRTLGCHLPVLNGANKAMKEAAYQYKTKYGTKDVNAASMTDINKAIMRCLTKNIALHGLGIGLYTKEDLTDDDGSEGAQPPPTNAQIPPNTSPPSSPVVATPYPSVAPVQTGQKICPHCKGKLMPNKFPDKNKQIIDYDYCVNYKKDPPCKYSIWPDGAKRTNVDGSFAAKAASKVGGPSAEYLDQTRDNFWTAS